MNNDNLELTVTGLKPRGSYPDFEFGGLGDDFSEKQKKLYSARRQAAYERLMSLDPGRMSDSAVEANYRTITGDLFPEIGPDTDGSKVFGKRKSANMRENFDNLKRVLAGEWNLIQDPDLEAMGKLSHEEQVKKAEAEESGWNGFTSWAKGERGEGMLDFLYRWMLNVKDVNAGALTPESLQGKYDVIPPPDKEKERKAREKDLLEDYVNKRRQNQPLLEILSMRGPGGLSDRGQWVLTKSLMDGHIDVVALNALSDEEQARVIAGFGVVRGDRTSGRILFVPTDFSTGTAMDRFQMGIYGLQQSFLGLGKDLYGLTRDAAMWMYGKSISDEAEREAYFEAWDLQARAERAEDQQLPEGGFWAEAFQGIIENLHWVVPYGGVGKLKKVGKGLVGKAAALAEKAERTKIARGARAVDLTQKAHHAVDIEKWMSAMHRLGKITERYNGELRKVARAEKMVGAAKGAVDAGIVVGRGMTFSSFAEEFLTTADMAGISREDSVLLAAAVGLVNERIERLVVPGLESNLTRGKIESMGVSALRNALDEGKAGQFVKDWIGHTLAAGSVVGFEEGAIEEPLQQIVQEWGKRLSKGLAELRETGEISAFQEKSIFEVLTDAVAADLKTYVETTCEMLPMIVGYTMTSGPRQQLQQKLVDVWGRRFGENRSAQPLGVANLIRLNQVVRNQTFAFLVGEDAKGGDDGRGESLGDIETTASGQQQGEDLYLSKNPAPAKKEIVLRLNPDTGKLDDVSWPKEDKKGENQDAKPAGGESKGEGDDAGEEGEKDDDITPELSDRYLRTVRLIDEGRKIYAQSGSDVVGSLVSGLKVDQKLAETLADLYEEEHWSGKYSPMNRAAIQGMSLADISEASLSTLPGFVRGSYQSNKEKGYASCRINVGNDRTDESVGLKDGEITLFFQNVSSLFQNPDGTVNEAALAEACAPDSDLGESYDARYADSGHTWAAMSPADRRRAALTLTRAVTIDADGDRGDGVVRFVDDKTGEEVEVRASSLIKLANGRLADLSHEFANSYDSAATGWDLRHEVFHALWSACRMLVSDDELHKIAALYGIEHTTKDGKPLGRFETDKDGNVVKNAKGKPVYAKWASSLDEYMARDIERFASGQYVMNGVESRIGRFQKWLGGVLGKMGVGRNDVLDENGKPFGLQRFFEQVVAGKIGSGDLGIARITTPKRPAQPTANAKPGKSELPVETRADGTSDGAADDEVPETSEDKGPDASSPDRPTETEAEGQQADDNKRGRQADDGKRDEAARPAAQVREPWDHGTWVEKRVPDRSWILRCRLRVVNAIDGLLTSWDSGFNQEFQERETGNKETEQKIRGMANAMDYSRAGRVDEFVGSGAPMVAPNGRVIDDGTVKEGEGGLQTLAGNHRAQAIRLMYTAKTPPAAGFREKVLADAALRGLEVDAHAAEAPVIVCELYAVEVPEGEAHPSLREIAEATNQGGFDEFEKAKHNANILVREGLVPRFAIDRKTGRIVDSPKASGKSLKGDPVGVFLSKLSQQERDDNKGIVDEHDRLTEKGQRLFLNAMTYALVGESNPEVAKDIINGGETLGIDAQMRALMTVTPDILAVVNDKAKRRYDIRRALGEALDWFLRWRKADKGARVAAGMEEYQWRARKPDGTLRNSAAMATSWENYRQDLLSRPGPEAEIIGDMLAASERAIIYDKEGPTEVGKRRAHDLIVGYVGDYLANVKAAATEEEGLLGLEVAPPTALEMLEAQRKGRFSVTDNTRELKLRRVLSSATGGAFDESDFIAFHARYSMAAAAPIALTEKDIALAVSKWGTTDDLNKAVYCLPDGTMLMGKGVVMNFGDERIESFGHDGWADLVRQKLPKVKKTGLAGMAEASGQIQASKRAIARTGAIRISGDKDGFTVSREPTAAQYDALYDMIEKAYRIMEENGDGKMMIDVADENLDTLFTLTYPRGTSARRIVDDLRGWYERGEKPGEREQSLVAMFHAGDNRWSMAPQGVQKGAAVEYPDAADELRALSDATMDARWSAGRQRWSVASQTDTPEFKAWFGNSKVVDANGKPLVVYHGTPNGRFDEFRKDMIGKATNRRGVDGPVVVGGLGFYFTNDKWYADGAGKEFNPVGERNPYTFEVYLSLQNPLIVEDTGWGSAVSQADVRKGDLMRWAEEGGHDGIIVRSMDELDDNGVPDTVYIAFKPEQIKSATDNRGTFDPTSPNVRWSVAASPTLREDVEAALNTDRAKGEIVKGEKRIVFCRTPEVLKFVGLKDADVYSKAYVLRKVEREHGVTADQIVGMPELINDPVAIFDDYGKGYVVLTTAQTPDEDGVLAPLAIIIRPDEEGNYIASAYSRKEASEAKYVGFIRDGKVLYLDKNKVTDLTLRGEAQSSLSTFSIGDNVATPERITAGSISKSATDGKGPRYSIGARRRAEFRNLLLRKRPDIAYDDVLAYLDEIAGYESAKKQKLAVHWLITGAIELPEDAYKLDKAIATSERAKVDPFQYSNPEDIFAAFPQHLPKDPAIDPDTVPELTGKTDMGHGITVYTVSEKIVKGKRRAGQVAMRKVINTHWGKDASPWCLLQGDGNGELTEESRGYWEHYSALPKKVAFLNGKLLAFMATSGDGIQYAPGALKRGEVILPDEEWWDRKDASHAGIPIEGKIAGDPLGRSGLRELKDGELKIVGRMWKGDRKNGMYEEWAGEQKALEEERKDGRMVGWRRTYRNGELSTVEHYNEKGEHDRPKLEFYPGLGLAGYVEFGERDISTLNVTFRTDGTLRSYGRHESPDGLAKASVQFGYDSMSVAWTDDAGDYYSTLADGTGQLRSAEKIPNGYYGKQPVDLSDAAVRSKLEGESAAVLEAVKAEAAAIYREYSPSAGTRVMDDAAQDVARWSIGGFQGAVRSEIGTPEQAERMEKNGADRTDIWRETGWWRGHDGKWRIELPDYSAGREIVTYRGFEEKDEFSLGDIVKDKVWRSQFRGLWKLVQAYPNLRRLKVEFFDGTPDGLDAKAAYLPNENKIEVYSASASEPVDIGLSLVHELQHAIQWSEGFSYGDLSASAVGEKTGKAAKKRYFTNQGEVEAYLAQARSRMSDLQRASDPPWETEKRLLDAISRSVGINIKPEDVRWSIGTAWRPDFPAATAQTTRAYINSHYAELFKRAKAGDVEAAEELVEKVCKVDKIRQLGKDHPNARIVAPVVAYESTGHNMIPRRYAEYIASILGIEVDDGIVQTVRAGHTGADALHRLFTNPEFDGEVVRGAEYIIVDDHITQGGTVNALRDHIERNGGKVVAVAALTLSQGSSILPPNKETLDELKRKWPDIDKLLRIGGIAESAGALTQSQAKYILKFSPDTFRDRAVAQGVSRGRVALQGALGASSSEEVSRRKSQRFSAARSFPRLNEMTGDEQLVAALAAKAVIHPQLATSTSRTRTPYGYIRMSRKAVEELVRRSHPEIANDYSAVSSAAAMFAMRAQMLARDFRKALDGGVSEQEILRRLPKKMEPVYRRQIDEAFRKGGKVSEYGMRAERGLRERIDRMEKRRVAEESGVETGLFETWAGIDFAATLAKVLYDPRELEDGREDGTEGTEQAEDAAGKSGGGTVEVQGVKLRAEELEDPRRFAQFVVDLGWKYWKERNRLGDDVLPWRDNVSVQFMRRTAQNVYRQLVRDIVYSGSRETVTRYIDKFETVPTIQGLISAMAFAGSLIHSRRIRETKQKLCEEIDTLLKTKLGAKGRFKPDQEELRRKVSAELQLRAMYMRHAMWLTKAAAAEEALQLSRRLDRLAAQYEESERDFDQSKEHREIQRKLNILREFGSLRYRPIGEIENAKRYWEDAARGSGEEILEAMRKREVRTQNAADILAAAVNNPGRGERLENGALKTLNDYVVGHMGFVSVLQDMVRYSKGAEREAAEAVIDYISREIQKAGDRARLEQRRNADAFHNAVESIYGRRFDKVMAAMNARDERFAPFLGTRGGKAVKPTKARAMQLLVSLLQGKRPGDSYYENVIKYDRQSQARAISDLLTTEDLAIVGWIGDWYERNRKELSDVCEELFGIGVYSESPNYFPVKMLMEKQGLESAEGVGWSAFPKTLTPRVKNERDFDTSMDIFSMWMSRAIEGAQWKAHAKLGLEMRGIFGRSSLQEAIVANHGEKVNRLMLEFVTDILSGSSPVERTTSGVEAASDWVRGWTALTALGGNVGVTFKQTTSIPAFGFEVGLRNTAKYILTAFTPAGFEAMGKIWSSEQRKTRWDVGSSEAVANALRQRNATAFKRLVQASMITNKIGDVVPALVVGQGIYRDRIEDGMSEEDAMAETWMLVERTQQSSRIENQIKLQRRQKLGRMLFQFLSTQQQYLQYELKAIRELFANPSSDTSRKTVRVILLNHFILTSLYFWMGELYKAVLGQEPPEDQFKEWMIANLMGPFGSLYVFGFMCKATLDRVFNGKSFGRSAEMVPLASFIKGMVRDSADIVESVVSNDKSWEDVLEEGMELLEHNNALIRDARKIDKYRLRPEAYEKK